MNKSNPISKDGFGPDLGPFDWADPLRMEDQLTEDERMLRDAANVFAQSTLQPLVTQAYREETVDPTVFKAMGDAGLLGLTIPEEYGGLGAGYVTYGLVAREIERVDSGYRSMMSVQSSLVMYPIYAYGNDHLDISSVKLYSDGALGSRGAAMIEPYSDDPENRGLPFWTQDELDAMVQKANDMGFQVGIHAIGDLGNQMALDAFEKAQDGRPSALRNRIEHSQIVTLDDIPRFAELGVIASMQATHATSDKNMAEDRIGPQRILGGYAWRRMLDAGVVLANGSDFPVELSNPFHGLYAAVTRQGRDGEPEGGWYADQALTRAEALHSFTLAAAYAARQEDRLGSLEPGKWADFIVIDRDYFTIPAAEIDDILVLETWVAGNKVYAQPETSQ